MNKAHRVLAPYSLSQHDKETIKHLEVSRMYGSFTESLRRGKRKMLAGSDIFHMLTSCWGSVICTLLTTASVSRLSGKILANSRTVIRMLSSSKIPQILGKHQQKPGKPSSVAWLMARIDQLARAQNTRSRYYERHTSNQHCTL